MQDPVGPITIIMNSSAGAGDKAAAQRALEDTLRAAGRDFRIESPSKAEPLDRLCARVAPKVAAERGILVAAGGDGTVNSVAEAARKHDVPLGVVPLGTFNYFARDRGLATDVESAARALVEGRLAVAGAGEINDRLVLNNASIGLYTELIRRRESAKARFGRRRFVATLSAAGAILRGQRAFAIHLAAEGGQATARTSMLLVSCNAAQLEALGLAIAEASRKGALGVILMKPTSFGERLRLLARAAIRSLDEDPALESFCVESFEVQSRRRVVRVVVDGELHRMRMPLRFRALPEALRVVVPRDN